MQILWFARGKSYFRVVNFLEIYLPVITLYQISTSVQTTWFSFNSNINICTESFWEPSAAVHRFQQYNVIALWSLAIVPPNIIPTVFCRCWYKPLSESLRVCGSCCLNPWCLCVYVAVHPPWREAREHPPDQNRSHQALRLRLRPHSEYVIQATGAFVCI